MIKGSTNRLIRNNAGIRMRFTITTFILFLGVCSYGQETVSLSNPSFEDTPRMGGQRFSGSIDNWFDCGKIHFKGETPPDIHPTNGTAWGVSKSATDGDTYLGLVVRDNDSWEAVSQELSSPLKAGQCYSFSMYLSTSKSYVSTTRATDARGNFDEPSVLRIWGSDRFCGYANPSSLLATSETIVNDEWKQYNFKIEPQSDFEYIILEAFYKTPTLIPYNGHILLDGASDFVPIPCDTEIEQEPILVFNKIEGQEQNKVPAEKAKPKKSDPKTPAIDIGIAETPVIAPKPKQSTEPPASDAKKPKLESDTSKKKTIAGLDRENILKDKGEVIIENLFFEADSFAITSNAFPILNEVYDFLEENDDIIVEIQGHTRGGGRITDKYCDALSTKRAKAVESYLVQKGIEADQLKHKGYGKRRPLASNRTAIGRKRNQRVVIKILGVKG